MILRQYRIGPAQIQDAGKGRTAARLAVAFAD
jgi:hypothetical protein